MRNIFFPHYLSGEPVFVENVGVVEMCLDNLRLTR